MNKLHTLFTTIREFSLATKNVKTPPINLEISSVNGSREGNSHLERLYSNTYLKEEPMVKAAGISDLGELKRFIGTALQNQHSLLLRERSSGEVVAAASGGPVTHNTHDHLRLYAEKSMLDPRSQRLVLLWADVVSQARLTDRLSLSTVWDVSFLATAPRMRRLGLAQFLVTQQRRLATRMGYDALSLYCACPHTAQLARKLGCRGLGSRPLDSYRDKEDNPWVTGDGRVDIEVFYSVLQPRDGFGSGKLSPQTTSQ